MKNLEVIIGLEVHAQMSTKTKLFCACDNDAFGKAPNTLVCPVCMGHPGSLPVLNGEAVKKAMQAAAALGCTLSPQHHLDRKNYFYPDLPMGYQISQYDFPLAKNGSVTFGQEDGRGQMRDGRCRILRLHIENDAGKLMHEHGKSLCDFNRAGTPLMEIVTEPDLRSAKEAVAFAEELRRILIAVNASDADMFKGMMRFDASISLRPRGEAKLYPRSEIKNLNSFKSLEKALLFEEKRLRELWEKNEPQDKEVTVHWDDEKEEGKILRVKESAAEYRYFPEPDIPPLSVRADEIHRLSTTLIELPTARRERYLAAGLSAAQTELLIGDPALARYFDAVTEATKDVKRAASVVLTQLLGFLKAAEKSLAEGPSAEEAITLLTLIDGRVINANTGKSVLEKMVESGKGAEEIIEAEGLRVVSDAGALEAVVRRAIEANPQAVLDIKNGKEKAKAALVGFVMKETKGGADAAEVNRMLAKMLQ